MSHPRRPRHLCACGLLQHEPHDQFSWLREHDPIYRHPLEDGSSIWAVTKHEDVRAIGRDHQTFSNYLGGIHIDDIRRRDWRASGT